MSKVRGRFRVSDEQAAVVDHVAGNKVTVVSAGAGSGKTYTMVATVLYLIEQNSANLDEFALITFTNKAADEMRGRLENAISSRLARAQLSGSQGEINFWFNQRERLANAFIGTIHGFCSMILKIFGYEEKVPHEKEVIMARRHFLRARDEAMNEGILDPDTSLLFNEINWAPHEMAKFLEGLYRHVRERGREVKDVLEETLGQPEDDGKPIRKAVAYMLDKLEQKYMEIKRAEGGVDTNDLLLLTAKLLKKHHSQIGPLWAGRYKYLFIDEFQDTDRMQKNVVQELVPYLQRVLVVGDRKQSIYAFRGAEDSMLEEIANENNVRMLPLSVSRRPTKPLLEVQNVLFKNMGGRYKVLRDLLREAEDAHEPADGLVPFQFILLEGSDTTQRIQRTIQYIRALVGRQIDLKAGTRRVDYKDICVLFRANRSLESYAREFKEADIPYVIDLGGAFFQKPEIVACYYMLQAILKYPNDVALDLALGTPFLPLSPPLSPVRHDHTSHPLCDWLATNPRARRWYEGMMRIRRRAKIDLIPKLLKELYEFTAVREIYAQNGDYQAAANLEMLITWAREQMNTEALTLQQLVDRMQTAMLTGEKLDEADTGEEGEKDAVVMSTIHSAKGLEYPIVIIPELQRPLINNDNLPQFFDVPGWGLDVSLPGGKGRSPKFDEFMHKYKEALSQEEARVFYVAVTRAQHAVCFISGGRWRLSSPEFWSWKDEVLLAYDSLVKLGPKKVHFLRN